MASNHGETVKNQVVQELSKNTEIILEANIQSLAQLSIEVYNRMTAFVNSSVQKKYAKQYTYMGKTGQDSKKILTEAYALVMRFRELIYDEEINYRIYTTISGHSPAPENTTVVELTTRELLQRVSFDTYGGVLKVLKQQGTNGRLTKYENALDHHISSIMNNMNRKGSGYYVKHNIIKQYGYPEGLISSEGKAQVFNRGWIYEAFDRTATKYYGAQLTSDENITYVSSDKFNQQYFTEELRMDRAKGFTGGDNSLTQIKANHADLMKVGTLYKYVKIINSILQGNLTSQQALEQIIKDNFGERIDQVQNKCIEQAAQDFILNQIQKRLQNKI